MLHATRPPGGFPRWPASRTAAWNPAPASAQAKMNWLNHNNAHAPAAINGMHRYKRDADETNMRSVNIAIAPPNRKKQRYSPPAR